MSATPTPTPLTARAVVIAAEFTAKTKTFPALLRINRIENGRRTPMMEICVSGKVEARRFAKKHGAQPWNF